MDPVRIPGEIRLHRVEQVDRFHVVGCGSLAGDAHHQHEIHEAVSGVAGLMQRVQGHLGQASLDVAVRDPVHRPAVELRIRPVFAELAGSAEFEGEMAGADDRHPLVRRPRLDEFADGGAELHEPLRLRQRRREDVGVDRHDGQVGIRSQRDDRTGDAVVDAQLVAERKVEIRVEPLPENVRGQVLLTAQPHPRQAEFPLLVVPVGVEPRCLADQELGHVVQPELVEVIASHHDQDVRPGPGQRLPEGGDLGDPFLGERWPLVRRQRGLSGSRTGGGWMRSPRPTPP